jgi:hypothetical protein
MTLTSDNIQIIKQFADKLEKWTNNLSYNASETKNFWVELTLFFYPQNLQATVSWLANIPVIGPKIQKDFDELTGIIHKVDIWHIQGVFQDELGEFSMLIDRLKEAALNIVFSLRKILETEKSEQPVPEAIALEKSESSELRAKESATMNLDGVAGKLPRKEALMAYSLCYETDLTKSQIAKRITTELKLGKPVRPWEVSRWIEQVKHWRLRKGLPVDSVPEKGKNPPSFGV